MNDDVKLLSVILLMSLGFSISTAFAETSTENEAKSEVRSMDEMVQAVTLEKKQVEYIVLKLVKSGRITPEEGEKARREIASIKDSDFNNFKNQALKELARSSN